MSTILTTRSARRSTLALVTLMLGIMNGQSFAPSGPVRRGVRIWSPRGRILTPKQVLDDAGTRDVEPTTLNGRSLIEIENNETEGDPPSLLEPGGIPTVAFSERADGQQIYKQAVERTLLWVSLSAACGVALWFLAGPQTGEEFFAGYLLEQSLSVDNLFVFLLLFDYFEVPLQAQDKVLNWGIYGAIIMRATMIGLGAAALENFHVILLFFASILVYSSLRVLFVDEDDEGNDLNESPIIKFARRVIDSTDSFDGDNFFTVVDGVRKATPLFICMIAVEVSDVLFAVDSIPAVFGVTENPLVVFASNMFAIMGLRSLYTILSKAATDLKYLEPAVGIVLGGIGAKMIAEYFGHDVPIEAALSAVAGTLGAGVGASIWEKRKQQRLDGGS